MQWQTPLEGYLKNFATKEVYDNIWLGFHGYNSENITDSKPYPGVVEWSEKTGLPTVVDIYPANQLYFPFNSPKFAYEIANEMKKVENFVGFVYWERGMSGTKQGPLSGRHWLVMQALPSPTRTSLGSLCLRRSSVIGRLPSIFSRHMMGWPPWVRQTVKTLFAVR
jgi:hypothetical protein